MTATDDHARPGAEAGTERDDTSADTPGSGATAPDAPGRDDTGAPAGDTSAPAANPSAASPAAPPAKPKLADAVVALKIPEFRRFWFAAIASNSGSWLQGLAMPFIMYEMTRSGAWVGASVFSIMLPMALVGPFAGPLADRIPRRTILIVCQSVLSVVAFAFAALWWSGVRNPWAYLATSVLYGIVNGFSMPAWQAFVSDLVPRELLMNAITLNSAQFNAARAIGPSIGGVVIAAFGAGWAFAGNAVSFLVVVVALVSLPRPQRRVDQVSESPLRAFVQGGRYARTQPGILTGYLAATLLAIFGGTLVQVHLVLFAEEVFDVSAFKFGLLVSAYGIGAILAAPWLASVGPRLKRSAVLVGGLVAFGLAELALVATTIYWVGLAGVVAAGAAHITLASTTNTTIQLQVTEAMRGRVLSMYLMVLTIGMPVGAMVQGPMADRFGPRVVVGAMGSMMLVSALLLFLTGRAETYDHELAEP
ncbi:MAG: MFS transporter [Acidimicrobiales bacterium]